MSYEHKGRVYRSFKHPMLEYIFNTITKSGTEGIGYNHSFTLADISSAYRALNIKEPASISNTILDLTRQDRGINSRLPESIIEFGYDLRKKTGNNFAGEFVYVGMGNAISSWYLWDIEPDYEVVCKNTIPEKIKPYLGRDEGALFSVIDYCDVLSYSLGDGIPQSIIRVQNPMKWQPNEIDGLYHSNINGVETLYPIEAKALSTGDHINLEQMLGAYNTAVSKLGDVEIVPLGIKMISNGMNIGVFKMAEGALSLHRFISVKFEPEIEAWTSIIKERRRRYNV